MKKKCLTVADLRRITEDLDPDMPVHVGLADLTEDMIHEDVHGRSTPQGFVQTPVLCIETM